MPPEILCSLVVSLHLDAVKWAYKLIIHGKIGLLLITVKITTRREGTGL